MNGMIAAKLDPPAWMGGQIRRECLLQQLDAALRHRLTLIHAPAGYGKTSLLAQWRDSLNGQKAQSAWLTLEREDRDLKRFSSYLLFTIQRNGKGGERANFSAGLPQRAALSALVNALDAKEGPFVLILDDFHHAGRGPVADLLASLLRLAPPNCHFVIASRDYPGIGQSVLAAEEQLLELTMHDLRFSTEEAQRMLARENEALANEDVSRILDRTEGWPIAVQLTSLSLKRGVARQRLMDRFSGSSSDLARYLSEQVLVTLPEHMREVVMRTALLDRLTGEMVDLLCDCEDGWILLESLERQGVFLSAASQDRDEYRYHQLFAEFLRERLYRSNRPLYLELQERLARWLIAHDRPGEAVDHAVQACNQELLAEILEQAGGWRLIPQGQQGVVEQALENLSVEMIRTRPRVALAQVYLQLKLGELGTARVEYDKFVQQLDEAGLSADLRTEIRVVGDTLLDYENRPATLEDLLEREALLRKLPADDHLVLANISETLGAKYYEGGWHERALQPTLAAREHYRAIGSIYSDLFTRFLEARIKRAQGRLMESAAILDMAEQTIAAEFGPQSDLAANCAAFQAELLFERDELAPARELLDWAIAHMENSDGWVDVYSAAYFTKARILVGDGEFDGAWSVIDQARRTASRRRLRQLELLADLAEFELRLTNGEAIEQAEHRADAIDLDVWAGRMGEESPVYRPVVVAAALCRVKLSLLAGRVDEALADLAQIRSWASQRGAGRLLIDLDLLAAYAHRRQGSLEQSRSAFDDAVGIAMFQGLARPFIEMRHFVQPCLDDADVPNAQMDRVRAQFLKSLSRSLSAFQNNPTMHGVLNEAEAEVLYFLSKGQSNKEIARLIGMSPDTVKYRLKSLFRKLDASKRADAVRIASERGLIPPAPVRSILP